MQYCITTVFSASFVESDVTCSKGTLVSITTILKSDLMMRSQNSEKS